MDLRWNSLFFFEIHARVGAPDAYFMQIEGRREENEGSERKGEKQKGGGRTEVF